jgi:hypothetical protein
MKARVLPWPKKGLIRLGEISEGAVVQAVTIHIIG